MTKPACEFREGQVYLTGPDAFSRDSHRRIVGLVDNRIFYSAGGDRVFSCLAKTFAAWRRLTSSTVVNKEST